MEGTGALILCGGRSSRMGQSKAGLRFGPETLLERVLKRASEVAATLVVSLGAGARPPPLPSGVLVTQDRESERGPLWGLAEGFRALEGLVERVVVIPVDMPFLTPPWMNRLIRGLEGHRACLYRWQEFDNPLAAAYTLDLLPKIEMLIAQGRPRPYFLSEGEPRRVIEVERLWREGDGPPPLMDMDTPEEYRRALLYEGIGHPGGAEVTVELGEPGDEQPAPSVPLYAATAGQVLQALARLYPEWTEKLEGPGPELPLSTMDGEGGSRPITRETPLRPGGRLRLHLTREQR